MKKLLRRVRAMPVAVCAAAGFAVWLMPSTRAAGPAQQTPVFRAGTEAVSVDVQVVGRDGAPITTLSAKDFSVNIGGGGRKVATASLVRVDAPDDETRTVPPTTAGTTTSGPPGRAPRIFVIAMDVFSFGVGESRVVVGAAQAFIKQLRKDDLVGLYTFPVGVRVSATADHTAVARQIDSVVGQSDALKSSYNLTIGEIVDINAEDTASGGRLTTASASGNGPVTRRVVQRECINPTDNSCLEGIQIEAQALGFYLEQRITQGVHGLVALVQYLATFPGRKTVVLLSGGMPMTDRGGGRPDVGDAAKLIGQDAAKANTVVYSLFVDTAQSVMTADRRRSDRSGTDNARTHALMGRLLDRVADVSGGTMIEVLMGGGEQAYQRILRETASHYLLGVEPTTADRTGEPRRLDVKVNVSGATVRSRQWVVVPKR